MKRSKVDKFIARYGIPIGMLLIASFHILKNWIKVSDSIAVPYLMLICLFMIYSGFRQGKRPYDLKGHKKSEDK